ncbi:MAG: DUF1887 family protein, partial [Firmicutes bacterium]|nr:DUF1887 family protein [Bacillota bacterium]
IRHYQPDKTILVCSKDTLKVSKRLMKVLENETKVSILNINPYDIANIKKYLKNHLAGVIQQAEIIVNVTGGTKIMFYAAVLVAQELNSKVVYLKSEKNKNLLYQYRYDGNELSPIESDIINETITIDDYLKVHIGEYRPRSKDSNDFEKTVEKILDPHVPEIKSNISFGTNTEVDLVMRFGNQVGVAEATAGKPNKRKIEQLNLATRWETLGVYTKRFLIAAQEVEQNNRDLAEFSNVKVIELLSYDHNSGELSNEDSEKLVRDITKEFD